MAIQKAKFSIGDIVKHKHFEFRGVIYDVDFEFNNSEEWYQSIPKNVRPRKDQPFYHLLAENDEITYEAYVSEQNLLNDDSGEPIKHPLIEEIFSGKKGSSYFKPSNWLLHLFNTISAKLRHIKIIKIYFTDQECKLFTLRYYLPLHSWSDNFFVLKINYKNV